MPCNGCLVGLDSSQSAAKTDRIATKEISLLMPIEAPLLPAPQPKIRGVALKKDKGQQESVRHSARIASKPKSNLTMEEQATALLIKKSGVLVSGIAPDHAAHAEFREQFTEPLKETAVGGFRELFGIPDVADGVDWLPWQLKAQLDFQGLMMCVFTFF